MKARATVRLQLHSGFTLEQARECIPYFCSLGITHLYLSPISSAVPGSTHGYDVIDPARVNPELGGEAAFERLAAALRDRHMGILLDIVPNHMATHAQNKWWWDVLTHGLKSRYARWFDIDWLPADVSLHGKVLAPFLGTDLETALGSARLCLSPDEPAGRFLIEVGGAAYPIAPGTLMDKQADPAAVVALHDPRSPEGRQRLKELLLKQNYCLCHWNNAATRINWRRFFEISGLIGVRVEDSEVFDAVHQLPMRLYQEGLVDGLRIDHVDGLAQPLQYSERLREAMRLRRPDIDEPWIVIEKILAPNEILDERFRVSGTTGYDFMDQLAAVLHSAKGGRQLTALWKEVSECPDGPEAYVHEARLLMLRRHFVAERKVLARRLCEALQANGAGDQSLESVDRVLEGFLAEFPVYRSYLEGGVATRRDESVIREAQARARSHIKDSKSDQDLLDRIADWLLAGNTESGQPPDKPARTPEQTLARRLAVRRFEQLTPPLAAKSLEDTVFYRYGALLSRNEVGSEPSYFAQTAAEFHEHNARRNERFREGLLATASHDHKRGEDTRARLAVLSEQVDRWRHACAEWEEWTNAEFAHALPRTERYMVWQALIGAWPLDLVRQDAVALAEFGTRVAQWQRKALREAKLSSSWFEPNIQHELLSAQYLFQLLGWPRSAAGILAENTDKPADSTAVAKHDPDSGAVASLQDFVLGVAPSGAVNSLVQLVLRLTVPGIPDLYQGTEWWDFSLVDPDNRRAVDYPARELSLRAFDTRSDLAALLPHWRDGRIKQAVLHRLLKLRDAYPGVFAEGAYEPMESVGHLRDHLIAFCRQQAGHRILVVVPRLCAQWVSASHEAIPNINMTCWKDTGIMVSADCGGMYRDVFSGRHHHLKAGTTLKAEQLLAEMPCAVLTAA